MNLKLEGMPTRVHSSFVFLNFCKLKGCLIPGEQVENQMQLNIVGSCCQHGRAFSHNTATGTYFNKIITDNLNEYLLQFCA